MKKKILLMENANHYFNIYTYYNILSKKFDSNFYIATNEDDKIIKLDAPYLFKKKNKIINAFSHKLFFLRCFFILKKFDYYFITYAPESNRIIFFINLILFYLFCLKNGNKIILRIADTEKYVIKKKDLFYVRFLKYIKYLSIKKIKFLVFENKTLEKSFKKKFKRDNFNSIVIRPTNKNFVSLKKYNKNSKLITLGIPGAIDKMRRDYDYLVRELNKIKIKYRENITIKFIGSSNKIMSNKNFKGSTLSISDNFMDKISKMGFRVISNNKGFISRNEYSSMMKGVDFLIDINQKDQGYFFSKSTGLVTDSYNFSKRMILNKHNDPYLEFNEMSIYYKNLSDGINKVIHKKFDLKSKKIIIGNNFNINKLLINSI